MKILQFLAKTILVCISILIISCSTIPLTQQPILKEFPKSFSFSTDSSTLAHIKWNQYFTDSCLLNLIDTAIENNLDLQTAIQRIEMAKSSILLRKGELAPVISVAANAAQNKFGSYTVNAAGNNTTEIYKGQTIPSPSLDYIFSLQTSWEVDVWGKLHNQKKAAIARFMSSIEARNLVLTNIIAEVSISYYELLALDNEIEILNQTIILQEKAMENAKILKQAGKANELAIKQFEVQVLNSKSLKVHLKQQITEYENRVNFLLGRYPQWIARNLLSLNKSLPIQLKTGIPAQLLQNRPDIKQAEFELMASKADVYAAKAAFYPSLNITGNMGFQAFRTNLLFVTPQSFTYGVLGSLTAPLINKSAIKAEFRRANASQTEAIYNYQKTIINGYIEVYNEIANIKNLEQIYTLKSSENVALTQAVEISNELFKTGRANYLEVLIAQQKALDANLELITTKKSLFRAMINIYKTLGGGWK